MAHINLKLEKFLRVFLIVFVLLNTVVPSSFTHAYSVGIENVQETNQQNLKGLFQTQSCPTSGDLVVEDGETCSLAAGEYTFNSVTIESGGTLIALGNTILNQGVTINANVVTVETGGIINADGNGYQGLIGSPSGPGGGYGPNPSWTGGGAGHGGPGQDGDGLGGVVYSESMEPDKLGSAGGWGRCGLISWCAGGAGGGAVKLVVQNSLSVDGKISANGSIGGGRAGGGSGGSILIEVGVLIGNGEISTEGAGGSNGGGSGGADASRYIRIICNIPLRFLHPAVLAGRVRAKERSTYITRRISAICRCPYPHLQIQSQIQQ